MTLVIQICNEDSLLLIADLLTSGIKLPNSAPALPTIAKNRPVPSTDTGKDVPRALVQKITLVGTNVALAWSGSRRVAEDVICRLLETRSCQQGDIEDVVKYLVSCGRKIWAELSVAGLAHKDNRFFAFGCGNDFVEIPTTVYGTVGLLGCGMPAFSRVIARINESSLRRPTFDIGLIAQMISRGLVITGSLIEEELQTRPWLNELFGGSYEIIAPSEAGLEKVGDVSYVYWDAILDSKGKITLKLLPRRVFRLAYQNDALLIRTIEPSVVAGRTSATSRLFVIPPVHRTVAECNVNRKSLPPFNTRWVSLSVVVHLPSGQYKVLTVVQIRGRYGDGHINFEETGETVHMKIEKEFTNGIVRDIKKYMLG